MTPAEFDQFMSDPTTPLTLDPNPPTPLHITLLSQHPQAVVPLSITLDDWRTTDESRNPHPVSAILDEAVPAEFASDTTHLSEALAKVDETILPGDYLILKGDLIEAYLILRKAAESAGHDGPTAHAGARQAVAHYVESHTAH